MNRFFTLLKSALMAFAILAVGQWSWGALLTANLKTTTLIPWASPVMALVLWAMWRFLSATPARRELLRPRPVSASRTVWTLVAGALGVVSLAGLWIVFFRMFPMSPNALPSAGNYPWWTSLAMVITSSLVSPISEEAGFRGYCQSTLERAFPGWIAVAISSILFAAAHLTHGFFWPKLLVYFLFGVVMGALARINRSILPGIPVHCFGDMVFFIMVWPNDAGRSLVWSTGTDTSFWIHVAQVIVFGTASLIAFRGLAKSYNTVTGGDRCEFSSRTNSNSRAVTA